MSKVTKVLNKDTGKYIDVSMTSEDKPQIDGTVIEKWQNIMNILARLGSFKASLINKLEEEYLEIFMLSDNEENPYDIGLKDPLGEGAYCERVLGSQSKLEVTNASLDPVWHDSLYVKYNLLSYYGLPIAWPDGELFGTLCVIDDKENQFDDDFQAIFDEFKKSIEKDLQILLDHHKLSQIAERDSLTGAYNRRKIDHIIDTEFQRCKRYGGVFSVVIMDIDRFKQINDVLGHQKGDEVLIAFADQFNRRIRTTDSFGRLGGDEFILVCPNTNMEDALQLMLGFSSQVEKSLAPLVEDFMFSYGVAEYADDPMFERILKRADQRLYKMKNMRKAKK